MRFALAIDLKDKLLRGGRAVRIFLGMVSIAFLLALTREPRFEWIAAAAAVIFLGTAWAGVSLLRRWGGYDPWLLPLAATADVLGLLLAFRLNRQLFYRQTAYSVLALLLMLALVWLFRRYPGWPKAYRGLALAAIGVLLLTSLAGRQINGAKSWLYIGTLGFEPSQLALAVFTLAIGMAVWRGSKEIWLLPAAAAVLAATHNLGAVLALALVLGGVAYLRGWNRRTVWIAAVCFLALSIVFYFVFPVVPARLALWFSPVRQTGDFQMAAAFTAFAKGKLLGAGFVRATPESIPNAGSDFVFAAWAEITGTWGAWLIVGLFLFYLYRGLKAGASSFPDAGLTARALAILIASQAFLQAGGNTGLIPLTGVAMPFVSGGGTTLVGNFLVTGMLLALGPPGNLGRRERSIFLTAAIVAGMIGLAALWRSLG
jgi:cell division protein FtsW